MPRVGKTHVTGAFFIIYLRPETSKEAGQHRARMDNACDRMNKHFAKVLGLTEVTLPESGNNRRARQKVCAEGMYETEFDHHSNKITLRFNLNLRSIAKILAAGDTAELARVGKLYAGNPVKSVSMGIRTSECMVDNEIKES